MLIPYRELNSYALILPEWPPAHAKYEANQLKLLNANGGIERPVALASGSVEIDQQKRELVITLQTSEGKFFGNGRYPTMSSRGDR